jgi:5-deoxy-glucuronate isomerase
MSDFKTCAREAAGYNPAQLYRDFKFIKQFGILKVDEKKSYQMETGANEYALHILEGVCTVVVDGQKYEQIGSRATIFDGLPTAVYVPIESTFSITGTKAKVAICAGKGGRKTEPVLITPDKVKVKSVGKDNWHREVRLIIGADSPSVNIILGETINFPGNWSGTPPHKHEANNPPDESLHEELYYFQTDKSQGWGIERFYSPERNINELIYLEQNTVTFMPWGYHQIVAGPGYILYYLFFLAGEGTGLIGSEDRDHNWIKI